MKILWITNIPFGPLNQILGQGNATSGSWLEAAYNSFANQPDLELLIVTVGNVKERLEVKINNSTFYMLPGGFPVNYDCYSDKNRSDWKKIRNEFRPDIIQVWGTEYTHGYLAIQVMDKVPAVIYMQGLLGQIARYYLGGISDKDLRKSISLRDIIKWDWIKIQQSNFRKGAVYESKMIHLAGNVIVENRWCEVHCKAIYNKCNIFKSKLSIKEVFFKENWTVQKMVPLTIMTNASGYPLKGLHVLLKALSIVASKYPQVKLLIPGEKSPLEKSHFEKLKESGYSKYIRSLIFKLNLKNNISFLGRLNSEEMAEKMSESNVFVLPSSIENHSSTLIEAMIVGVPCISSYVGGVPEYVKNELNGLLYRFEDHEILADCINRVFENQVFAEKIALTGRIEMREARKSINFSEDLLQIYSQILKVNHQDLL